MVFIDADFNYVKLRHVPNVSKHLFHALLDPHEA